jgi:pyruvate/2-oxoglutarate dehydrogenase complex dihydrolipoamide dehydrogenase (E3) component
MGTGHAGKPLALDLASARVAYLARRATDYGARCGPVAVDLARVRARKQAIVGDFQIGEQCRLEQAVNIELVFGPGRFTAPKVVEVTLKAGGKRAPTVDANFINTGCRPATTSAPVARNAARSSSRQTRARTGGPRPRSRPATVRPTSPS